MTEAFRRSEIWYSLCQRSQSCYCWEPSQCWWLVGYAENARSNCSLYRPTKSTKFILYTKAITWPKNDYQLWPTNFITGYWWAADHVLETKYIPIHYCCCCWQTNLSKFLRCYKLFSIIDCVPDSWRIERYIFLSGGSRGEGVYSARTSSLETQQWESKSCEETGNEAK